MLLAKNNYSREALLGKTVLLQGFEKNPAQLASDTKLLDSRIDILQNIIELIER